LYRIKQGRYNEKSSKAQEAIKSFDIAIRWLETQNVDFVKIMQLRNLRDFARRQKNQGVTQKKITDFFQKVN
jgi:hypothetical protein